MSSGKRCFAYNQLLGHQFQLFGQVLQLKENVNRVWYSHLENNWKLNLEFRVHAMHKQKTAFCSVAQKPVNRIELNLEDLLQSVFFAILVLLFPKWYELFLSSLAILVA